jgi:hypothetical protein
VGAATLARGIINISILYVSAIHKACLSGLLRALAFHTYHSSYFYPDHDSYDSTNEDSDFVVTAVGIW